MSSYRTVKNEGFSEIEIKKSRFIGRAYPVKSEEEARDILEKIRKENYDASHNCFAYSIGNDGMIARFSDDGEPGGTAGLPMLEVIKARELTDVLIIVTRYFGGTLLGAGGLVRAYSKSAAEAIKSSGVCVMLESKLYELEIEYSAWDRIQARIAASEYELCDGVEYAVKITSRIWVKNSDVDVFFADVAMWSEGTIKAKEIDSKFKDWQASLDENTDDIE